MKFVGYMAIRNTNPRRKNSLSVAEAKVFGININEKGWPKKDIDLTEEQIEEAVNFCIKI